jgi:uncharacterized protein
MHVSTKKDLIDFLVKNSSIIKDFGVTRVGLFGSFVRDEQKETSDIDLLVEFDPEKKNFDNFMGLANFLEDSIERKVDLLTPESLSPYIGPRILKEVEYHAL